MASTPQEQESGRRKYLFVHTFGCQMNEYDSLRVQRILGAKGYLTTQDMYSADVIFINTCSVREKAEQKVHSLVGRLRKLKDQKPSLKIIVAGCVAQQLGNRLIEKFSHLDLVIGTRGIGSVGDMLDKIQANPEQQLVNLPHRDDSTHSCEAPFPENFARQVTAPVTIMQGCDNFCTYCIVPHVRGREESRPSREVVAEIQAMEKYGVREVLLIGQNVNSYGKGLGEETSFVSLLRLIQKETNILRLRFTTSHPKDLTHELMEAFVQLPMLCSWLHLPFQSGSDRVLKMMNRKYTSMDYLDKIEQLLRICPDMALSSDVMVGFPGETEQDFLDTLSLIKAVQFDSLFSFRYSDRPFTKSRDFPHRIPKEIKAHRLAQLQALQAQITMTKNLAEIGKRREVLVEGESRNGQGRLTGRTEQNRAVNFTGPPDSVGRLVMVEVEEAFSHSLRGRII